MSQQLIEVQLSQLERNPLNPQSRTPDAELVSSIKEFGIKNPLLVKTNGASDKYIIISGERRFEAAKQLKLAKVPVIVQEGIDEQTSNALLLVDNIHRKNMNMYEEYQVISELLKTMDTGAVAKKLNKSTNYVVRRMNLSNLTEEIVEAIQGTAVGLSERMVFIFARIPKTMQKQLWKLCVTKETVDGKPTVFVSWTEDQLESRVRNAMSDAFFEGTISPEDAFKVVNDKLGQVALDKAIDKYLDEKSNTLGIRVAVSEDKLKEIKKTLRVIKEVQQLSVSNVYSGDILGVQQWRAADDEDDEKSIKEGVMIDGPKAGMLVQYIKVNPNAQKKADNRTPKQKEKDKAERSAKIFENKVTNETVRQFGQKVMEADLVKNFDRGMLTYIVNEIVPYSFISGYLRRILSKEEYSKVGFGKAQEVVLKHFSKDEPLNALLKLLLSRQIASDHTQLAKLVSVNVDAISASVRKTMVEAKKKEQQEKEAERIKRQSDAKAAAKRNKKK